MMKDYRDIKMFNRILRYEIFSVSEKRQKGYDKTIRLEDDANIRVTCFETVNQHDKDLLFVLVYFFCEAEKHGVVDIVLHEDIRVIAADFYIRDISLLLKNHDYDYFKKCLDRLTSLTIFFSDRKKSEAVRFIQHYKINEEDKTITVYINYDFYLQCKKDGLIINLTTLLNLKKQIAKQLYCVIISNSNISLEKTLIERTAINANRYDNAQRLLRQAFEELVKKHVIKNFTLDKAKNGKWHYVYERYQVVP
jgi:hypothetical protein